MSCGMLSEAIENLRLDSVEMKLEISPENWDTLVERYTSDGVKYNQYISSAVPCDKKRGKNTRAWFCTRITRRDDGRYEWTSNT